MKRIEISIIEQMLYEWSMNDTSCCLFREMNCNY